MKWPFIRHVKENIILEIVAGTTAVKIAMVLFGAIRPNPFTFEIKRKDNVLCLLT